MAAGVCGLSAGIVPLITGKGSLLHRKGGKWLVGFAGVGFAALVGDVFFPSALWLYPVVCTFMYDLISYLRALQIRRIDKVFARY